jgi:hypothetical protein
MVIKHGTWSYTSLGRVFAFVPGNSRDRACEMKNQSSLSSNGFCCLFDQVYACPDRGISTSPSLLTASLNLIIKFGSPLGLFIFSCLLVRLKSPIIIQR